MSEVWLRLLVVLAVTGAAVIAARYVSPARLVTVTWPDVESDALLFSERTCQGCGRARERLQRAGIDFTEVDYADDAALFREAGVDAVPTVAMRGRSGVWAVAGKPTATRLLVARRRLGK